MTEKVLEKKERNQLRVAVQEMTTTRFLQRLVSFFRYRHRALRGAGTRRADR